MVGNLEQYEKIIRGLRFLESRLVARKKRPKNKVFCGIDRVSFLGVLHVSMCWRALLYDVGEKPHRRSSSWFIFGLLRFMLLVLRRV